MHCFDRRRLRCVRFTLWTALKPKSELAHDLDDRPQPLTVLSELILDFYRHLGEYRPPHEACLFECSQIERQHALRDFWHMNQQCAAFCVYIFCTSIGPYIIKTK